MTAEQGSLNLLPGTHLPESSDNLFRSYGYFDRSRLRLRLHPREVPGVVSLHTMPGDVVIWDTRSWHSAFKRKDGQARRALFFSLWRSYEDHRRPHRPKFDPPLSARYGPAGAGATHRPGTATSPSGIRLRLILSRARG